MVLLLCRFIRHEDDFWLLSSVHRKTLYCAPHGVVYSEELFCATCAARWKLKIIEIDWSDMWKCRTVVGTAGICREYLRTGLGI